MRMIERVARAIKEADGNAYGYAFDGDLKVTYEAIARYAIAAMREPTEAMLDAEGVQDTGCKAKISGYLDYFSADEIWKAMIDAALADATNPAARSDA